MDRSVKEHFIAEENIKWFGYIYHMICLNCHWRFIPEESLWHLNKLVF